MSDWYTSLSDLISQNVADTSTKKKKVMNFLCAGDRKSKSFRIFFLSEPTLFFPIELSVSNGQSFYRMAVFTGMQSVSLLLGLAFNICGVSQY